MSRRAIEVAIAAHIGIPYRHGGRGSDGLDCLGLVVSFYRMLGIEVPDGDGMPYSPDWWRADPGRYLRGIVEHGRPVEGPLQALDFVYFAFTPRVVTHGAVMVDGQRFIHVLEGRSVMVSRLAGFWKRKLAGARRLV